MTLRSALEQSASPLRPLGEPSEAICGWQRHYILPPSSLVFAGHFPTRPVLPAVAQCLMAQMTVEAGLGRPLQLVAICHAKFTAVLGPAQEIILRVIPARKDGEWDCTLHTDGVQVASLRLHLEETVK